MWFRLYLFVVDGLFVVVFMVFVIRGKLCFFFTFGCLTFAFFMVLLLERSEATADVREVS